MISILYLLDEGLPWTTKNTQLPSQFNSMILKSYWFWSFSSKDLFFRLSSLSPSLTFFRFFSLSHLFTFLYPCCCCFPLFTSKYHMDVACGKVRDGCMDGEKRKTETAYMNPHVTFLLCAVLSASSFIWRPGDHLHNQDQCLQAHVWTSSWIQHSFYALV